MIHPIYFILHYYLKNNGIRRITSSLRDLCLAGCLSLTAQCLASASAEFYSLFNNKESIGIKPLRRKISLFIFSAVVSIM